jgi:ABC-2 type transport system ATP-binding protein
MTSFDQPAPSGAPLLEARDLTVRYGKVTALNCLDLTAPAGQVLAVLGPNGAGKTTFVRTVATLVRPDGGHLRVLGRDVASDPAGVRRDIGLAGQFAAVEPSMTGRDNVELTAGVLGQRGRAARRAAAAVISQLSLDEVADRRCSTYSGGQRRRLDLGASLVGAPRLLLLDEPTTGLDPGSRREVWAAVRALAATGTGIVLTTHYLEEADELADHIAVIDHGRVIAAGSPGQLKASAGRDYIEVSVADEAILPSVAAILRQVTAAEPRLDQSARRVQAPASDGPAALAELLRGLREAGISVDEIGVRRPTLDEAFLSLTSDDSLTTNNQAAPALAGQPRERSTS